MVIYKYARIKKIHGTTLCISDMNTFNENKIKKCIIYCTFHTFNHA